MCGSDTSVYGQYAIDAILKRKIYSIERISRHLFEENKSEQNESQ